MDLRMIKRKRKAEKSQVARRRQKVTFASESARFKTKSARKSTAVPNANVWTDIETVRKGMGPTASVFMIGTMRGEGAIFARNALLDLS